MENQVEVKKQNQVTEKQKGGKFSEIITSPGFMASIRNTLQDEKKVTSFVTSAISLVNSTPALAECTPISIVQCCLLAEELNLPIDKSLGRFYAVPFKNKGVSTATPVVGYKGYLQLAMQSGCYKKIVCTEIKKSEFVSFNPLEEELIVNVNLSSEREKEETIGYYAMFEYINGFKKSLYFPKAKMEAHATKYSKGYALDKEKGWTTSQWTTSFDEMAKKTMLRQLLSKWGILSKKMIMAFERDMALEEDGKKVYPDNPGSGDMFDEVQKQITADANTGEVLEFKEESKDEESPY